MKNKKLAIITAGEKIPPVLQPLTLPLSLEEKHFTPGEGYDGFSYVEQQGLNGNVKVWDESGKFYNVLGLSITEDNELVIMIE